MAACGFPSRTKSQNSSDCDDCVQVVRSYKTVQLPCTRNTYRKYTVKVPRQVSEQVPRTVYYTEMTNRQKTIPYTVNRCERRTRMERQKYQVPVKTSHTRMVNVTRKVPRTVYVNVTTQVPQKYTTTNMETRERQVTVPYYVNIPETRYRTVMEQVPVKKTKVEMDTINKTVYDSQVRTHCVPETRMVTKRIPVYSIVPRPAPPCPPEADCGGVNVIEHSNRIDKVGDGNPNYNEIAFSAADKNKDGQLSFEEYRDARSKGNLSNTSAVGSVEDQGVSSRPVASDAVHQAPSSGQTFGTQSSSENQSYGAVPQ